MEDEEEEGEDDDDDDDDDNKRRDLLFSKCNKINVSENFLTAVSRQTHLKTQI
jgi:hypothetical protein